VSIKHAERIEFELGSDDRFQETYFFVDGENGVVTMLWGEWDRGMWPHLKTWKQDNNGISVAVGSVGGEVLRYSFLFSRLNGHLVGFYESERLLADMNLIDAWLNKTPAGKKNRTCNALNFGHCVQAVSQSESHPITLKCEDCSD